MNEENENNIGEFTSLDEYLSFVRHELRGSLFVTREGISQVLDALVGKDWEKNCEILQPAYEHSNKLKQLIDELLSPGAFNSITKQQGNSIPTNELEALKNSLIAMISHEVRTPLTIIKEGLSLVMDQIPGKLNPDQIKLLQDAQDSSDRLIQVIEKILHTSPDKIITSGKTDK